MIDFVHHRRLVIGSGRRETSMIAFLVLLIVLAVVWVLGTLPWLAINFFLCARPEPSVACAAPETYSQQAGQILSADLMLIICAGLAIWKLRKFYRQDHLISEPVPSESVPSESTAEPEVSSTETETTSMESSVEQGYSNLK